MAQLRTDLPHIDLRIQTADRDLDLLGEGIPMAVRAGISTVQPSAGAWICVGPSVAINSPGPKVSKPISGRVKRNSGVWITTVCSSW